MPKFKLESKKARLGNRQWVNGWRWKIEFASWSVYQCEIWEDETEEMSGDYCWYIADTKKELKQHQREHHAKV